jgi:tripartite-type tricarboxylate transporter receptor subunit TctC
MLAMSAAILAAGFLTIPQVRADDFYKGRQVVIICGFAPGGGYDAYARLFGRHIGRFIPGNPSVVVQNMEGAGTVRASNHVYVNAVKDGTVIAAVNQNMPMYQMLGGKAAQFEAAKMRFVGSLIGSNGLLYTWQTSPTKTIADAKTRETPLGGTGTNSDSHIFPTFVNNVLGTKFKVINGYSGGTREINIALERGEVEGRGGNSWAGLMASSPHWVQEKKLNYLVQIGLKPEPAPELAKVPLLIDLVASAEDKLAVEVITVPTVLGYAYWLAPEVPGERIETLRKAFDQMAVDAQFMADAEKSNMLVKAQTGADIEALVKKAAGAPPAVLERTAKLLEWKN